MEHRDRLGRVNTELVEAALSAHGRRLVVLDSGAVTEDLVGDMVESSSGCALGFTGGAVRVIEPSKRWVALGVTSARPGLSVVSVRMCGYGHDDRQPAGAGGDAGELHGGIRNQGITESWNQEY